jgi:disulfide bond formation protein DsbB
MRIPVRVVFAAIFLACAAMIVTALFYFQDELGLDPCPMCILSRYTFIVIGLVALVAAIHGPRGRAPKVYASIIALFALVGMGISLRHSYLQHFPPVTESCGSDLEMLMNTLPLTQALPRIFAGTGSCSQVDWKMLGLSIPEWALVWFFLMGVAALWAAFRRPA